MSVADVSGPIEPSQSTDRDAEERAGLGLLLRFIGAVFLVLLGGLLLLDRALGRANRYQASVDARSAALIAESYVNTQRVLLDRVAELVAAYPDPGDTLQLQTAVVPLLQNTFGARRVWVTSTDGRRVLDIGKGDARLADSVDRVRAGSRMTIAFIR